MSVTTRTITRQDRAAALARWLRQADGRPGGRIRITPGQAAAIRIGIRLGLSPTQVAARSRGWRRYLPRAERGRPA